MMLRFSNFSNVSDSRVTSLTSLGYTAFGVMMTVVLKTTVRLCCGASVIVPASQQQAIEMDISKMQDCVVLDIVEGEAE